MNIPSPWIAILLSLAAYRIFHLLSEDEILERLRRYVVLLPRFWQEGDAIPSSYRIGLAKFISCCWCLGAWVSIAVWTLWQLTPHVTEVLSVPFAISAVVGLICAKVD